MFLEMCQNSNVLSTILFIKNIINIISIVVPIILIIMLSVEIFKMVISSNSDVFKKGFKGIVKKTIAAVCVFFVPSLVNLLLSLLGKESYTVSSCWTNANSDSIASYRLVEEAERKQAEQKIAEEKAKADAERKAREEIQEEIRKKREEEAKKKEEEANKNNGSSSTPAAGGIFPGTKYNLTEQQLIQLARVCKAEQGSVSGAAAEASLMANLFERASKTKYGTGADGLVNYVRTSGWFAHAASTMSSGSYTSEILAAVRDVLVNGNRTMPTNIVEHDCWNCNSCHCSNGNKGDICKIIVGGKTLSSMSDIKNRSNYIKDDTIIYNAYGAIYKFYTFPSEKADPFGYITGQHNEGGTCQ